MLIFGVLGVIMISLFTTSTASSVTRNDSRRALYMAESGTRYAFSALRNNDFDEDYIVNTLTANTFNISDNSGVAGSFDINLFGPWFEANQLVASGTSVQLSAPVGPIPQTFDIPLSNISAVNFEFMDESPAGNSVAAVSGLTVPPAPTWVLTLSLSSPFTANVDERVCMAVQPTENQTISAGGNLRVSLQARDIFPKYNGAVSIRRNDYYYTERFDDEANGRVELRGLIVPAESADPLNISAVNDYVILSPRNYLVLPTGASQSVTHSVGYDAAMNIYDASLPRPGALPPDIDADELTSNLSEIETTSPFFQTDTDADTVTIGGGSGSGSVQFGSAWYDADKSIGGTSNYCQQGACSFRRGIRAFFLVDFISQGDGITFALTNASSNTEFSVGGDIELSELMGYAGDSRTQADGSSYLAADPADRGIDPPKIAVEFDARTNNPILDYCADANTVNSETRNDPLSGNQDAVQYIFWGRPNSLNISCRNNSPLYDDNRHDSDANSGTLKWAFNTGGPISLGRPAVGHNGNIHITASAADNNLYALDPDDGTVRWTYDLEDVNAYMPGIDRTGGPNDGTIYSDRAGNVMIALNPDGTEKWQAFVNSDIDSTPTVGPNGTIYFGTDEINLVQSLFAVRPNGTIRWQFATGGPVNTTPALNSAASVVYAVSEDRNLYAVDTATGVEVWRFAISVDSGETISSPAVDTSDDTIYVGSDDNNLYAINPDGTEKWRFATGGDIDSTPTVDPDDGTIYVGSDDNRVWALNPDGTEKWQFLTGGDVKSSAVIDFDGTIVIGSLDGNVYAFNTDGTVKWIFADGGGGPSSPALGIDGVILIGSNDTNFYAINQFAEPRNFRDENQVLGKLLTPAVLGPDVSVDNPDDWFNGDALKGPWAVRLEVDRSILPVSPGLYDYRLSLWLRQCQNMDCSDILGTFFQDTRLDYEYTPAAIPDLPSDPGLKYLPMVQEFQLNPLDHARFDRFFFGFTGAAGAAESQNVNISQFQLSFIRPGDPVVTADPSWP
jgi:outer membrane protein assembly factor BamB